MDTKISMRYEGGYADQHRIPAYDAGMAIYGLSRSVTMISHYLVEGEVRKRAPFSNKFELFYTSPRQGSFAELFQFVSENPMLATLGAMGLYDTIKFVLAKATGQSKISKPDRLRRIEHSDDVAFDALVDGVTPSVKGLHKVIGTGVEKIVIVSGDSNQITFNETTKEFVNTTIASPLLNEKEVSVAGFNVNTKYGRVFDRELGVTVPCEIGKDAEVRTIPNLTSSLNRYASQDKSMVVIKYRSLTAPNGEGKKYIIYDAWFIEE